MLHFFKSLVGKNRLFIIWNKHPEIPYDNMLWQCVFFRIFVTFKINAFKYVFFYLNKVYQTVELSQLPYHS